MKRAIPVATPRVTEADARLERITRLEQQLSRGRLNGRQRRAVRAEIQIEADAYRRSLDTEQATATHDTHPRPQSDQDF